LIVDDDERFRQGLRTLLQWFSSENFCSKIVVEEAALPEEALRVGTCNHREANLQSSLFRPGLFATINQSRPGLNENEPAIIAFRPAIIRLNRD
jgi:hypothetical protein